MATLGEALLTQAQQSLDVGPGRPAFALVRRATSTAYYALFHQLISHSVNRVLGLQQVDGSVSRWFQHSRMKEVSKWFVQPKTAPRSLHALLHQLQLTNSRIRDVADAFVQLQEARHLADYQWYAGLSMTQARSLVGLTQQAFAGLYEERRTEVARVYGILLLTGDISVKR